jgi:hypothetical protein
MEKPEPLTKIIYPSPMVYNDAVNIALMVAAVDKYMQGDDCFNLRYVRSADNKKHFDTDVCNKPSKVVNVKLNITEVVWGRIRANYEA